MDVPLILQPSQLSLSRLSVPVGLTGRRIDGSMELSDELREPTYTE